MFLKSITLQGFKSFADRTEISFSDGITAIVGPNGCGKSNVLDAVRWVLGEQSAKSLRGARMLDVIFSGSRSRKPASFAEVMLHFDNRRSVLQTEARDVTVGRVLFRNGDSEYKLNGQACRLKDVRDLFLDTGVGVDAYSVIEQGRVDRLLQASPLERREIFEEAAGISRYKVRRNEAQRKLERTQQNLLRLNDVVAELERQLRSVKLAAAKARKYQEHDARLRALRSNFALAEYHGLRMALEQRSEMRAALEMELAQARAALAERDETAAQRDRAIQDHERAMHAAAEELRGLELEIGTLSERTAQGEARIAELESLARRRAEQEIELSDRAALLESQSQELGSEIQSLITKVEERSGHVDELQQARSEAEARCAAARSQVDAEKTAIFEVARRTALLNNQYTNLTEHEQRISAARQRLCARKSELEAELASLRDQRQVLQSRHAEHDAAVRQAQSSAAEAEEQSTQHRLQIRDLHEQLAGQKERRSALVSRRELLADLDRRHEGIGAAARLVLGWRDASAPAGGVLGLVADLLAVEDPRLSVLQHLLARFERHVVVRSAAEFLAELERRGAELPGALDLIALDRVPALQEGGDYGTVAGGVVRASQWVTCPAELRPLAEWLLGRVFVVDSQAEALKRAERAPAGYTFVAATGEVFAGGGVCTVGPLSPAEGLLTRKAEIRLLDDELVGVELELTRVQRAASELEGTLADIELQRSSAMTEVARLQRGLVDLQSDLSVVVAELGRAERSSSEFEREAHELQRSTDEVRSQLAQLQEEQRDVHSLRGAHEQRVADLAAKLQSCEQAVALHSQQLTEALVEIGRQAERRAAAEQGLRELAARIEQLRQERSTAAGEAQAATQRAQSLREECAAARRRQSELTSRSGDLQARLSDLRAKRVSLREELDALGREMRGCHEAADGVKARLHECDSEQRELAVRQENVVVRVREELGLELEELFAQYSHTEQDWDAIRREIDDLREKIQRLGNVNLDSIQELEELSPRYDALVAQRADLEQSITRLTQLITDLDVESHRRFTDAFNEIRANFQELFRKLFGGGRADVILEDPDKPLECGIEVIARPPGKEPQSISLLSGGEKTMTCVALLMAVFKSKPSPFAILDEVDAALDEANVERFSRLLHEFLTAAQFVVITHNKKTMAAADVLYGVTMEEPGVSKHVSVRFDDRVHTPNVA